MASKELIYKQESIDFTLPILIIVLLIIVWLFLSLMNKKGKSNIFNGFRAPNNNDMNIVSIISLPRGGQVIKTKIDSKNIYFLYSNNGYKQIDMNLGSINDEKDVENV